MSRRRTEKKERTIADIDSVSYYYELTAEEVIDKFGDLLPEEELEALKQRVNYGQPNREYYQKVSSERRFDYFKRPKGDTLLTSMAEGQTGFSGISSDSMAETWDMGITEE